MKKKTQRKWILAWIHIGLLTVVYTATAHAVSINFDTDAFGNPLTAPPVFVDAVALTDLYKPLGVQFFGSGPGGFNGGAILNEAGGFGVPALSTPNFLAFNSGAQLSNGGIPIGPETIVFDIPATKASIFVAGGNGSGASFLLQAFDSMNMLVDTDSVSGQDYNQLSVSSSSGIKQLVLIQTGTDTAYVADDLSFTPVPEPSTMLLFGAGLAGLAAWRWKTGKQT